MYTCMKNHEFMPDILVSPIFSQLSKREENKIFQRCSNLVIQRMQVLFLSSSQTFMHCQKLQDLIHIWSQFFMNPISWKHIPSMDPEIYPREVPRDNFFAFGGSVFGNFTMGIQVRIFQTPDPIPSRSTHVWFSSDYVIC